MQIELILIIISVAIGMVCLIDLWNKKCSVVRRVLWSPVPFIPLLGPMLYYALFEPPAIQPDEERVPEDQIERWKEWIDNRYNPGYFTGGQIHPMYSVTGTAVGVFLLVTGGMDLAVTLYFMIASKNTDGAGTMFLLNSVFSCIAIWAGLTRISEGKKKKANEKEKHG